MGEIDGLLQDCSISSALALEILQSCNKTWMLTCSIICQTSGVWIFVTAEFLVKQSLIYLRMGYFRVLAIELKIIIMLSIADWHAAF